MTKDQPISVAKEQCGMVGVNSMLMRQVSWFKDSTLTPSSYTICSCSNVSGFSGSRISRIKSETPQK